ncbi:MAG: MGMT family protein [Cyclobacteriaceae bacterium]
MNKATGQNFFDDVYEVVRQIPHGRITSYGAIAEFLGIRSGARMVGWAMNSSHAMPDVPAHRVVNRLGLLTGKSHFDHPDQMAELLKKEGIEVVEDQIINFSEHFWDPSKELQL